MKTPHRSKPTGIGNQEWQLWILGALIVLALVAPSIYGYGHGKYLEIKLDQSIEYCNLVWLVWYETTIDHKMDTWKKWCEKEKKDEDYCRSVGLMESLQEHQKKFVADCTVQQMEEYLPKAGK